MFLEDQPAPDFVVLAIASLYGLLSIVSKLANILVSLYQTSLDLAFGHPVQELQHAVLIHRGHLVVHEMLWRLLVNGFQQRRNQRVILEVSQSLQQGVHAKDDGLRLGQLAESLSVDAEEEVFGLQVVSELGSFRQVHHVVCGQGGISVFACSLEKNVTRV